MGGSLGQYTKQVKSVTPVTTGYGTWLQTWVFWPISYVQVLKKSENDHGRYINHYNKV